MDRLRQRADFLAVANGARVNSPAFVLQRLDRQSLDHDDRGPIRIGFTVTKKNGNAPERNRIRRRLRELVKRLDRCRCSPIMIMCWSAEGTRSRAASPPCSTICAWRSRSPRGIRTRDAAQKPTQEPTAQSPAPLLRPAANRIDDERMMTDNRNTILAVILSGFVLIAWQYFYNMPAMEKQRAQQQAQAELQKTTPQPTASATPGATPQAGSTAQPSTPSANQQAQPVQSRDTAIATSPRVKIETPRIAGSISLKGGRLDDVALVQFRETVDPKSPPIILYSPSGT